MKGEKMNQKVNNGLQEFQEVQSQSGGARNSRGQLYDHLRQDEFDQLINVHIYNPSREYLGQTVLVNLKKVLPSE